MNVNEYGNMIRINVGENILLNNNTLMLTSPVPVVKTKIITQVDGLAVGVIDITIGSEVYKANEYVEYIIQPGDIFIHGTWVARLHSHNTSTNEYKITDNSIFFTVNP